MARPEFTPGIYASLPGVKKPGKHDYPKYGRLPDTPERAAAHEMEVFVTEKLLPEITYDEAMRRLNGHKALYLSLLKKFNGREMSDRIFEAADASQTDNAIMAAHTLKGAASNLSLQLLADCAKDIEAALKEGLELNGHREKLYAVLGATEGKIALLLTEG